MNILELIEELELAAAQLGNRPVPVRVIVESAKRAIDDVSVNHETGAIELELQ